jgi:transposase InsO family protein
MPPADVANADSFSAGINDFRSRKGSAKVSAASQITRNPLCSNRSDRRGWDSNPRYGYPYNGFRDRSPKGLRQQSKAGWRTFISNHAQGIAALDLFVVPTLSFRLLFGLLILRHDRREILWLGVTAHPTAEWIAQQVTEAIGWERPPKYLLRNRDQAYGDAFMSRIRAMGIRDRPTAARSPWQNAYCERAIGSIRRDCLDHVIVFGERHLLHLLRCYASYYNRSRTHLSLNKDAPTRRPVHTLGRIEARPVLGGLHHHYVRI